MTLNLRLGEVDQGHTDTHTYIVVLMTSVKLFLPPSSCLHFNLPFGDKLWHLDTACQPPLLHSLSVNDEHRYHVYLHLILRNMWVGDMHAGDQLWVVRV